MQRCLSVRRRPPTRVKQQTSSFPGTVCQGEWQSRPGDQRDSRGGKGTGGAIDDTCCESGVEGDSSASSTARTPSLVARRSSSRPPSSRDITGKGGRR